MTDRPGEFNFCVSHTSRAPRAGEVDGKNYHFSQKDTMKATQGDKLRLVFIFIQAPSMDELESRIVGRGQETPEKIQVRLQTAKKEMEFASTNPKFFDMVLTNVDLEESLTDIQSFFALRCGV